MSEQEWRTHILAKLDNIDTNILQLHIELASLKVKSTVWGLAAGSIPIIIGLGLGVIKGFL